MKVSVIIPTAATAERADSIKRALQTIRGSFTGMVQVIVSANGPRCCPRVIEWLRQQPDVLYTYSAMPSIGNAVLEGRKLVKTPFFSTLDDDDEYLPGATNVKLSAMLTDHNVDVVVTNGYMHRHSRDELLYSNLATVRARPLATLFEANWLHNCNALYRSNSIGVRFFECYHPYAEWTWLAFKIASAGKCISALDVPTFRYHDSPNSLSKSEHFDDAYFSLYGRMLAESPPEEVRKLIRKRISAALHARSTAELVRGKWVSALSSHVQSLFLPGGLRYLSYSRKLIPFWPR